MGQLQSRIVVQGVFTEVIDGSCLVLLSYCKSADRKLFFLAGALCLSTGRHLRLTRGPAGNRTTTGSLSATQECHNTN